ncbi:MAG: TonB-dependent receptor [Alphaproteobacteria bacterium]
MLPDVLYVMTKGGVIQNGPLGGTQFDANGNWVPFQFGSIVNGTRMVGGDAATEHKATLAIGYPFRPKVEHASFFTHTDYDITSSLHATLEASYSEVIGGPVGGAYTNDFNIPVKIDNAFLPAAMRQAMINAGVTSFGLNRLHIELGRGHNISDNRTSRIMFGLDGDFFANWKWDAYYQYGETTGKLTLENYRVNTRWTQAIDAVVAPNGTIVCRSTLTDPGNGCLPFNLFGAGRADPASARWINGDYNGWQTREITQSVAAANLHGALVSTWAGPIEAATGVEYRSDSAEGAVDPITAIQGWSTNNGVALPETGQDVTEGYVELSAPLLRDSSLGKSLELNLAARQTSYSESGDATTWKVGLVYKPIDDLMIRATRSADIRAPSAGELSPLSTTLFLPLNDPATGTPVLVQTATGGNPNLELEEAKTTTIGFAYEPSWFRNFKLSVDYYNINVGNAIDTLPAQATLDLCKAGNAQVCQAVTRDAAGQITLVRSTYQNLSNLRAEGVEIVSDYGINLADVIDWLKGDVHLSLNATHVNELSTTDASGLKRELSGFTGNPGLITSVVGVPKWRYDAVIGYSLDRYALSLHARYIGPGLYDPAKIGPDQAGYDPSLPNSISNNHIDQRYYFDLSGSVNLFGEGKHQIQFFGRIENLFDTDPPDQLRYFGNAVLFDVLGRKYRVGVRTQF